VDSSLVWERVCRIAEQVSSCTRWRATGSGLTRHGTSHWRTSLRTSRWATELFKLVGVAALAWWRSSYLGWLPWVVAWHVASRSHVGWLEISATVVAWHILLLLLWLGFVSASHKFFSEISFKAIVSTDCGCDSRNINKQSYSGSLWRTLTASLRVFKVVFRDFLSSVTCSGY